jgi:hypothetical protein
MLYVSILAGALPFAAQAGVITAWNGDNVVTDPGPYVDETTYYSVIYDQDVTGGTAGATTNGRIAFEPPEATDPGLKVVNDGPDLNPNQDFTNCIMASSVATCESPFQSGKRFKQQITDTGPIDLVFDVTDSDAETAYRVFQKVSNYTNGQLGGFDIELGFGLGGGFVMSVDDDGLGFDLTEGASARFPFGLFGDADTNQNHDTDGFFDPTARSGFNVSLTEDLLSTESLFGMYDDLFGAWLNFDSVPQGYFWDDDGDPTTDAVLMAYLNDEGQWVDRDGLVVDEQDLIDAGYYVGIIEDLANLNVDYFLLIGDVTGWSTWNGETASFTIRLTPNEVPVPATLSLLGIGALLLGARRRRR